jgi:hypothetical protein
VDIDVVPVVEGAEDGARGRLVGRDQVAQRLVREHHAPAESVVGPVALDDRDLMRRILLLEQQRGIQAGRPATDAHDLHCPLSQASQSPAHITRITTLSVK